MKKGKGKGQGEGCKGNGLHDRKNGYGVEGILLRYLLMEHFLI